MARSDHLPIFKGALDLAVFMEKEVYKMSRYNKYSIDAELRKRTLNKPLQLALF